MKKSPDILSMSVVVKCFTLILTWLRSSNWCKPILTCQLTSSETVMCEMILLRRFSSLLRQLRYTVSYSVSCWVNIYLLVNDFHIAHIIRWVFFDNNFQSLNLLEHDDFSKTHFTRWGSNAFKVWWDLYFCCKFITESNSERFWKTVKIWQSYHHEFGGQIFWEHSV